MMTSCHITHEYTWMRFLQKTCILQQIPKFNVRLFTSNLYLTTKIRCNFRQNILFTKNFQSVPLFIFNLLVPFVSNVRAETPNCNSLLTLLEATFPFSIWNIFVQSHFGLCSSKPCMFGIYIFNSWERARYGDASNEKDLRHLCEK